MTPLPLLVLGASLAAASAGSERKLDVGGYGLFIRCEGSGAPVVVLEAGGNLTHALWSAVQAELGRETTVCSYDRANLGASDARPRPNPVPAADVVEETRALLRAAGVPPPYVLVGHSLGGLNVLLYADRRPGEVAGLVFVDATGRGFLRSFGGVSPPGAESIDYREELDRLDRVRLGTRPVSVLVGIGTESPDLARRSSNSVLVDAQCGHMIPEEKPALLAAAILQVVSSARTGAPLPACEGVFPALGGLCPGL